MNCRCYLYILYLICLFSIFGVDSNLIFMSLDEFGRFSYHIGYFFLKLLSTECPAT